MLQPVNLQLAHFNIEHSAQISKDALAAAQQTGQGQEVAQESVKRTQMVQAGLAATEPRKVQRREEDERERRREEQRRFSSGGEDSFEGFGDAQEDASLDRAEKKKDAPSGKVDFYA
ncbi:MAG: hypothetical protein LBR61_07225 [Synergistaceae bacterium]|jgi:hypothetical protein|nr:hypothetical protein [Synergistaceae bacterium]